MYVWIVEILSGCRRVVSRLVLDAPSPDQMRFVLGKVGSTLE